MSLSTAVLPDYDGPNLTGVIAAVSAPREDRPLWLPEVVRQAEQVVLLVVDGLGWLQLDARRSLVPNLESMTGTYITSVVPTTTATALTSLVVGAPPARHGVVGYRVVVDGPQGAEVMNVLKWKTATGDARSFVDPLTFQVLDPFKGKPIPVVSRSDFAGTPFTVTHQRGAPQLGWSAASGLAVEVKRLVGRGEPVVYAYYDAVDRVAHIHGFGDHYDAELIAVDRIVGDLLDLLPSTAALVVTADHGQVEVGERATLLDPRILEETCMISGEARFRWLHARNQSDKGIAGLAELAREIYGGEAWVATYKEVEAGGWFGGPLPPEFRSRVGDVALVPFEPVAYLDTAEAGDARLACRHGSLTEAEMLVPLIASAGRLER